MASIIDTRRCYRPIARNIQQDLVVSGLDRVEMIGADLVRFVLFVDLPPMGRTAPVRVAAERDLVMPIANVPDGLGKTMLAVSRTIIVSRSGNLTIGH
jgi:hypothetical protein